MPQPPQFPGLLERSTQPPWQQLWPCGQAFPQAPQLLALLARFAQAGAGPVVQQTLPVGQQVAVGPVPHIPPGQTQVHSGPNVWPGGQVLVQVPLHSVVPCGHAQVQVAGTSTWPPVQPGTQPGVPPVGAQYSLPLGQPQAPAAVQYPLQHSGPYSPAGEQAAPTWEQVEVWAEVRPREAREAMPPRAAATAARNTVRRGTGLARRLVSSSNRRSSIATPLPARPESARTDVQAMAAARASNYLASTDRDSRVELGGSGIRLQSRLS